MTAARGSVLGDRFARALDQRYENVKRTAADVHRHRVFQESPLRGEQLKPAE